MNLRNILSLLSILFLPVLLFGQSAPVYESNQLFIRFEDGKGERYGFAEGEKKQFVHPVWKRLVKKLKVRSVENPFFLDHPDLQNTYVLKSKKDIPARVLKALNLHPDIRYAERIPLYQTLYTPNDPSFSQQWHHQKIRSEDAWDLTQGSSDVVIAIIDDAVITNHVDLENFRERLKGVARR